MYPRSFHYHRATLAQGSCDHARPIGDEAKLLAGGQSLIPLMKLRFANPQHLVDLNFIVRHLIRSRRSRHSAFRRADSARGNRTIPQLAAKIPILHDCAAGIADVQVRNRGTIGGSLAEADPSGDWATVSANAVD